MNPLFRIDFSISDSLKIVRKSVLIYETIIVCFGNPLRPQKYAQKKQHNNAQNEPPVRINQPIDSVCASLLLI